MTTENDGHIESGGGELRQKSGGDDLRFLVFTLCDEEFAVPLLKVKEVIAPSTFTPVPQMPAHFKGIMNLRGQVISVIDLRQKFKMKTNAAQNSESAIVILDVYPLCLGVTVDSVNCVLSLTPEKLSPPPDLERGAANDYVTGVTKVGDKMILLLDIEKTLSLEDLKALKREAKTQPKAA